MDRSVDRRDARLTRLTLPGRIGAAVCVALVLAVLSAGLVWPLIRLLDAAGLSAETVTSARFRGIWWFTIWQAVASTVLALAVGLPLTWALSTWRWPGQWMVRAVTITPFVLPPVVIGLAVAYALPGTGRTGVGWLLAGHVVVNLAVVVRMVGPAWLQLDDTPRQAARTLGAGPMRAFTSVTVPMLRRAIAGAAAVVLLFCLSSFGMAKLLLGGTRSTIEVEIARQALQLTRADRAAALGMAQLVLAVMVMCAAAWFGRRSAAGTSSMTPRRVRTARQRLAVMLAVIPVSVVVAWPLGALVYRSVVSHGEIDLSGYRSLTEHRRSSALTHAPIDSIVISIRYAVIAALITVVVATAAVLVSSRRYGPAITAIITVPMAISAVLLGLGALLATRWVPYRWESIAVPLTHAVIALPLAYRSMDAVASTIDADVRAAAALAGASPTRVWWWIDRPILQRAMLSGAALAAAVSLGEFGAATFLARADSPTVPVAIVRLLGRPGAINLRIALAMAVVLMVMVSTAVVAADRLGRVDRRR